MTVTRNHLLELRRMEEAFRKTQRQLDIIERQIMRKMAGWMPVSSHRGPVYRCGQYPEPGAFIAWCRSHLAEITALRQPEIDALSRKLARQEAAVEALRVQLACRFHDLAHAA